ncbi:TPA: hypothetical protein ACXP3B_005172, partial [Klebsiella pneumoniae]|uniref:ead/Ea22-like family protein n=1 Tax=Klebsiella pneumoniae TaxID=573 RepID=UPI003741E184|nr:ead/Ea22-like family protein [Klebsiella pneumoniae subsp. pneumoniae]
MTNITELAQLRDRTVDYPYYLVECDCGKIYPSSELSGGEPMGDSGDYSDCYCPHCGEGEEHFAECADPETAWKAQQDKIDALVEALEKAQGMETYWKTQCRGITDHCEVLQARIAELESRTVTVKQGEVLVTVAGFTGCGKSAIAGEIEIAMKAIGVPATWANGDSEKRMTGADWLTAIEMYKPTVRIVEVNIPRAAGIKVEAE